MRAARLGHVRLGRRRRGGRLGRGHLAGVAEGEDDMSATEARASDGIDVTDGVGGGDGASSTDEAPAARGRQRAELAREGVAAAPDVAFQLGDAALAPAPTPAPNSAQHSASLSDSDESLDGTQAVVRSEVDLAHAVQHQPLRFPRVAGVTIPGAAADASA